MTTRTMEQAIVNSNADRIHSVTHNTPPVFHNGDRVKIKRNIYLGKPTSSRRTLLASAGDIGIVIGHIFNSIHVDLGESTAAVHPWDLIHYD